MGQAGAERRPAVSAGPDPAPGRGRAMGSGSWRTAGRSSSPGPRRAIWSSSTGLREHKRFARARLGRVLEPSSAIGSSPAVPITTDDECGGCQLQHLDNAAQLASRRALRGRRAAPDGEAGCPGPADRARGARYDYRTKLTLHVGARRPPHRSAPLRPAGPGLRPEVVPHHRPRADGAVAGGPDACGAAAAPAASRWCFGWTAGAARHLLFRRGPGRGLDRRRAAAVASSDASGRRRPRIWWQPEGGAARAMAGAGEAFPGHGVRAGASRDGRSGARLCRRAARRRAGRSVWDLYAGIGETTAQLVARGRVGGKRGARPPRSGRGRGAGPGGAAATRAGWRMCCRELRPARSA